MRKTSILILMLLFLSCAPRLYRYETLDVNKLQKNIYDIYTHLSSKRISGEFILTKGDINLTGKFIVKRQNEDWIIIVKSPIFPAVYKISEDSLLFFDILKGDFSQIPYIVERNSIIFDTPEYPLKVETRSSLPVSITYGPICAMLSYKEKKIERIMIKLQDTTLLLKLNP